MPFNLPTLRDLIDRSAADIKAELPDADLSRRRGNYKVLSRVLSGAVYGLYGFLDWMKDQFLPDTAEAEYLDRHAALWNLPRIAATPATGTATLTGTAGATVPAGTLLQRTDGTQYATSADVTFTGATATAAVAAVTAGQAGNAAAGVSLSLVSPVAGVQSTATVASGGLTGGADAETDDALRARILDRLRQPPMGGAKHDYVQWALQVAGVTRAWCVPQYLGDGTVALFFVRDNDADLIPDAAEVAAVQAYVDTLRPVTAKLTVLAPTPKPLAFTIQLTPASAAVKAAVEAELRDLLLREAEPGATILLSHIREAISLASGETDHVLTAPAANVTQLPYEMATFGGITWA